METHIAAGEFKAKCLKILDQVHEKRDSFIITKRGVPFAIVNPLTMQEHDPVGWMAGTVEEVGDIISPLNVVWNAELGKLDPEDE